MGIEIRSCRICGASIPVTGEGALDTCLDCALQLALRRYEAEWRRLTVGHTCPSGKCDL